MVLFEQYIFKSASLLSMLYLAYWFTVRNGSRYSLNRIFLLTSLILSAIIPVLSFIPKDIASGSYNNILGPLVIHADLVPTSPVYAGKTLSILAIIYIGGATYFCLRFFSNLSGIFYLYYRFPKYKFNGFKAVILDTDQAAFTFFNLLFISRSDYESGDAKEVIVHEKAHRDEYHSVDIILLEIMTIIQWFNPFLWALGLSLKSEHEFIADNKVLKNGFDKVQYQKLLFEKASGITSLNLTNHFNYSLLKKRLKIMSAQKSKSKMNMRYLLSIPSIIFVFSLFAANHNSYAQMDIKNAEADVNAEYIDGGVDGMRTFVARNIKYPKSAYEKGVSAKIYVQFVVDEKGNVTNVEINHEDKRDHVVDEVVVFTKKSKKSSEINSESLKDLEAEAIRLIKLLKGFKPAQKNGKNVKSLIIFPIHFMLDEA